MVNDKYKQKSAVELESGHPCLCTANRVAGAIAISPYYISGKTNLFVLM